MSRRRSVHPRRSRARSVRTTARLVLLGGVLLLVVAPISWERLPDFSTVVVPSPGGPPNDPGPGIDPDEEPEPPDVIDPAGDPTAPASTDFAYFELFGDQPPYVSTCSPVPFEIRTDAAPEGGAELVFGAIEELADATGISFEFVGYTDDIYDFNARPRRFSWEDDRDPIWIGWATDGEVPDLGPEREDGAYAVGVGGPITTERSGDQWEVLGGGVVLRAGTDYPVTLEAGESAGNILLHELAHALGLTHVDAASEQMFPTLRPESPDGYANGDLAGLAGITDACG